MSDHTHSSSFWDTVIQDADRFGFKINPNALLISRLLQVRRVIKHRPSFACVFWLRVNQLFVRKGWRGQFRIARWRRYRFANDISPHADIGAGLLLPHLIDVTIGGTVKIGRNATIYNGVTLGNKRLVGEVGMPQLGDNVIIYTGTKVIGEVQIGNNSEIGALSLCNKDVPANCVMYGIPPNVTIRPKENTL